MTHPKPRRQRGATATVTAHGPRPTAHGTETRPLLPSSLIGNKGCMGPRGVYREPVYIIILSMVTCGIYYFYWRYTIACELREYLKDPGIHPVLDVVLSLFCLPYSWWVDYSYCKRIEDVRPLVGLHAKEIATSAVLFGILGCLASGAGFWVSAFIIQGEVNALWQHGQDPGGWNPER